MRWVIGFLNVVCCVLGVGADFGGQIEPLPSSGQLTSFRDRAGQVLSFHVVGAAGDAVWGTDIYTDDSRLNLVVLG